MNRSCTVFLAAIAAMICLSRGAIADRVSDGAIRDLHAGAAHRTSDRDPKYEIREPFLDRTQEIIGNALTLIHRNEREGAPLDQRWYAYRRFGENLKQILTAREVRFYGGTQVQVLKTIAGHYASVSPIEADQDNSDVRLFVARRDTDSFDLVIIGQNGSEVALKTVIRLIYLFKFADESGKRAYAGNLDSFLGKIRIYLSSTPPRQEFISFFHRYGISDPDVVIIGFERDARAVLQHAGFGEPERHSSDSLRANWYRNANGRNILLVSINGNRIFASRAGELVEAMFETFRSPPHTIVFFGAAGAINTAGLVGQIVAPTIVVADDYFDSSRPTGKVAHIINNRAAGILPIRTAHISVESIAEETMNWAAAFRRRRIMTVDQELYHVIHAINGSPVAPQIQLFVGMLVTDNVSALAVPHQATLQQAEDLIGRTADVRREFLTRALVEAGIISRTTKTPSTIQINQ